MSIAVALPVFSQQGLCSSFADPDIFFPERYEQTLVENAKKVCLRCPIYDECRTWSLNFAGPEGIWGGTTPNERKRYHRLTNKEMPEW